MKSLIGRGGGRVALLGIGILVGSAGIAVAASQAIGGGGAIHACYRVADDDRKGELRVVSDPASCRASEAPLAWSQTGPQGPQGDPGPAGPQGPPGPKGDAGGLASFEALNGTSCRRGTADGHIETAFDGNGVATIRCVLPDTPASLPNPVEAEPNDTPELAQILARGSSVDAALAPGDRDVDWYREPRSAHDGHLHPAGLFWGEDQCGSSPAVRGGRPDPHRRREERPLPARSARPKLHSAADRSARRHCRRQEDRRPAHIHWRQ